MKYLITGASGPLATSIIENLKKVILPTDLILLSRKPEKLEKWAKLGAKTCYGDFREPETIEKAAIDADKMMLISGYEVGHRIKQHSDAIDAAIKSGVKHIVYTSYYGKDPNTALVCIDHRGTEAKLKSSGVAYTALRDGMYMDTVSNAFVPTHYSVGKWITSTKGGKISMVDRRDVAACAAQVLTSSGHENKIYNITGTDTWSFQDIADLCEEICGKSVPIYEVSDQEFWDLMKQAGIPEDSLQEFNVNGIEWCLKDIMSGEVEIRKGTFDVISHDIENLLGRPANNLRDFMWDRADQIRETVKSVSTNQ